MSLVSSCSSCHTNFTSCNDCKGEIDCKECLTKHKQECFDCFQAYFNDTDNRNSFLCPKTANKSDLLCRIYCRYSNFDNGLCGLNFTENICECYQNIIPQELFTQESTEEFSTESIIENTTEYVPQYVTETVPEESTPQIELNSSTTPFTETETTTEPITTLEYINFNLHTTESIQTENSNYYNIHTTEYLSTEDTQLSTLSTSSILPESDYK